MTAHETHPSHEPHIVPGTERGVMVVVVGPSGAGKDTLMAAAANHFVRRVITRDHDAGGEDHLAVSPQGFASMEQAGSFSVWWEAHGLKYGIPSEVSVALARGNLVIANGSRSALHHFKAVFPRLKVINVTARAEVLATRLEARGRETHEDIMARLARGPLTVRGDYDVVDLDNSDSLEQGERRMVETLTACLAAIG
jgi:ribose 1,5-bisphosphokinase